MNTERMLGMLCGIGVGLVIAVVILRLTKTNKSIKCEYDERQQLIRGKGYRFSFFILFFYMIAYGLLTVVDVKIPADNFVVMMFGICIAVAAQVIYCTWNEAYVSMNESPKRLIITFGIIGLVNIAMGIFNIVDGSAVEDGVLTFRCANLMAGILCVIVIFVAVARHMSVAKEED